MVYVEYCQVSFTAAFRAFHGKFAVLETKAVLSYETFYRLSAEGTARHDWVRLSVQDAFVGIVLATVTTKVVVTVLYFNPVNLARFAAWR